MTQNILILHCHDLGRFLGLYGIETVDTPNLDALADEAAVFENAFSTAPHCSPSRASLFTSSYPQQNGVLGLTHEPFGWDLRDPSRHLAYRLKSHGYRTELIGVHHESKDLPDEELATRLGFDRVRTGGDRDVVTARAKDALDAAVADGAPFYLQVGYHEPHRTPSARDAVGVMGFLGDSVEPDSTRGLTVPPYLRDDEGARAEIAELQGAVRAMDEGVGEVLGHLDELGLRADTIVVFTTDHGLALPRAKCTLYDAGIGVALIVRAPGRPGWSGIRVEHVVSHVDVVPTVFELIGLPAPASFVGSSLLPLIERGEVSRRLAFAQLSYHTYYDPKRAVRSAEYKLIVNFSNAPRAMDPTQSWVHRSVPADLRGPTIGTSPLLELYDVRADPHETENLADDPSMSAITQELSRALLEWMRDTDDPLLQTAPENRRHRMALTALATPVRELDPALP